MSTLFTMDRVFHWFIYNMIAIGMVASTAGIFKLLNMRI